MHFVSVIGPIHLKSLISTTGWRTSTLIHTDCFNRYATIWSWAPGEPKNSSSDVSNSLFRCATSNIDLGGRWVVNDCSQKYYSACRAANQPYNWTITTYPVSYSYASQTCPSNYSFGAPRTALENSYLTQAIRDSHRDYDGHGVWVDFNSLNYQDCWVSGGPNATCPYKDNVSYADDLRKKTVLVSNLLLWPVDSFF